MSLEAQEQNIFLSLSTPLDGEADKFFLHEIRGREQISGLFFFRLTVKSQDNSVDFSRILGQSVTVDIHRYDGSKRPLNGLVTRFVQGANENNFTTYHAEIRPWFWQLRLTRNSKIFQNQSVLDIVGNVFAEFGMTDFQDRTTGTYLQREYCVQYQETAFAFISRLLEEEGIFYFFEHEAGTHTLVLSDDSGSLAPCPNQPSVNFKQVAASWHRDDTIEVCTLEQQLIPDKYAADDYSFETPDTDLLQSAAGQGSGDFRIYEYPGKFDNTGDGEAIVNKRMESLEWSKTVLKGRGNCRGFISGFTFELQDHDRSDVNGPYFLRTLSITATQEGYANSFEAIPADVPFRPACLTPKPRIFGTQTAFVTGKSGEEIWPDNYGRVKVQFHWDQEGSHDENSSCWIRVAQVWAGKTWGTLFTPRIGTEVVVSFVNGDPDRPLIVGTVYNADRTVPYSLPDNKTRSTIKTWSSKSGTAGNEIRFEDAVNEEELYIHAQKDQNIVVENDRSKAVLNAETNTITKSRSTTVKDEDDTLTLEQGNRVVQIQTGDETHTVAGDFVLNVDGNLSIDVKGSITLKAGTSMSSESGTSMSAKSGTSLSNEAGTSLSNEAGTSLSNKAGTTMSNEAGISLTNKGSASQTVDGGGMLTLKGGMVKIN